jgi:precorrin-6B methylase 2
MNQRIDNAFEFVTSHFTNNVGTLGDGTQALSRPAIKELAIKMSINPGDTIWEFGCGCPKVAFSFSAAACGGVVIATDKCEC